MHNSSDSLMCRHIFNTQNLIEAHPPKLRNSNKKVVYQIACPSNSVHNGELVCSHWRSISLSRTSPILPYDLETGFWGCGAYGGNRVLIALLQLLAARIAQIDRLVFHTTDTTGSQALATAQKIIDRELAIEDSNLTTILEKIDSMSFKWGVGDGN